MTLFSFRWDNMVYGEGVEHLIRMNLYIDQVHTEEKIRYVVPMRVIDIMTQYDITPGNKAWWTLHLSLEVVLT